MNIVAVTNNKVDLIDKYGLIGYPLSHSFSPDYFMSKFEKEGISAHYTTYPLSDISQFSELIQQNTFRGLNVTIPYKEAVIDYLDSLDEIAAEIGAVNTIKWTDAGLIGYNTDVIGFRASLMGLLGEASLVQQALVLGDGGAAKAVYYVLKSLGIPFLRVSRSKGDISYDDLDQSVMNTSNLIINTTPLGMYPNVDEAPNIPYKWLNEKYFLYDLVYNPEKTLFLTQGINMGCATKNGHDMLILQADAAWHIWNQPEI